MSYDHDDGHTTHNTLRLNANIAKNYNLSRSDSPDLSIFSASKISKRQSEEVKLLLDGGGVRRQVQVPIAG